METQEETVFGEGNPFGDQPVAKKVEETFGTPVSELPVSDNPYALTESWSRGREYKKPFNYTIPTSGQTVKVKRLDMGDLLRLGVAEQMDFMTKALMDSDKKETGGEAVTSAIMKADNFDRMEEMVNKIVLAGLLQPKPHMPPLAEDGTVDEEAKKDGILYVDEIPFADRMDLFSVIFESDGLATFRNEQTPSVGDVETMQSVQLPAD